MKWSRGLAPEARESDGTAEAAPCAAPGGRAETAAPEVAAVQAAAQAAAREWTSNPVSPPSGPVVINNLAFIRYARVGNPPRDS